MNDAGWESRGEHVGRYVSALVKPLLWGVAVGGNALALFPDGDGAAWAVAGIAQVAVVLAAVKPPRGTKLLELPERSQLLRLAAVTAAAVLGAAADVPPSAYVTGAVVHLAMKSMRWRPLPAGVVAGCVLVLVGAGWLVPPGGPHVLLTSGDPVSLGAAVGDVVRILVVAFLVYAATKDQRTADAHAAERDAAVREERTRIARELHDVVAHHVSVMTIQSEAAGQAAIAETGRTAMTELRRMVGVLRSGDGSQEAALDPQPGLDDLERLVAEVRSTGSAVTLVTDGTPPPSGASEGLALSAYRIVQEALTNALRHAPGEPIDVRITYGPSAMRIDVTNGGRARAAVGAGGHGLVGMKERARLLDGSLTAGPIADGDGWRVKAELPLT